MAATEPGAGGTDSAENARRSIMNSAFAFFRDSPTAYHAGRALRDRFLAAGFVPLNEVDRWELRPGGAYVVSRGESMVAAFRLGSALPWESGFRIAAAHTDSPALKLKARSVAQDHGLLVANTEVYGAPIVSTWTDRPLRVAGRVAYRGDRGFRTELVDSKVPVATVPNLALHLAGHRENRDEISYNRQTELKALFGLQEPDLIRWAARLAGADPETVLDVDLYLGDATEPVLLGDSEALYSSPRLDNLTGCFAVAEALAESERGAAGAVGMFFDNEEVGSLSAVGAHSWSLPSLLQRIVVSLGGNSEDVARARARSFLVSNDATHAFHPGYADRYDPDYSPIVNGGPVIKYNANMTYTSTGESASYFANLCAGAGVSVQRFANRSDIRSGSTIGPVLSAFGELHAVDVGVPIFAMHSIRETGGAKDLTDMTTVLAAHFGSSEN